MDIVATLESGQYSNAFKIFLSFQKSDIDGGDYKKVLAETLAEKYE